MADLVVTVPKNRWSEWLAEGALPGDNCQAEYAFGLPPGDTPPIKAGERVYVAALGRIRGFAPLIRLEGSGAKGWALVRGGGAVAVTIDAAVRGFQGWRVRWWPREEERAFPDWAGDAFTATRARGAENTRLTLWQPENCPLCKESAASGETPRPHAHRTNEPCRRCGQRKVWPRPRRAGELFCHGCGAWWTIGSTPPDLSGDWWRKTEVNHGMRSADR